MEEDEPFLLWRSKNLANNYLFDMVPIQVKDFDGSGRYKDSLESKKCEKK